MNDETLVLYYYRDGLPERERRRVAAALAADPDLARRYESLCADLDDLSAAAPDPVPEDIRQRLHASVDRIARPALASRATPRRRSRLLPFAWGATVTAAVAIGIGIGVFVKPPVAPQSAAGGDSFTRGMQVYLASARHDLATLPTEASADRSELIMQIVNQNRVFERAAEQNDADKLARVLRAFEPILLRLAADDIAPEDAEALRAQLAFELNVMLTKLARAPSKETTST